MEPTKYIVDVPFSAKVRVTVVSDQQIKDGELVSKILDDGRQEWMRSELERTLSKISSPTFEYKMGTFLTRKISVVKGLHGKRGSLEDFLIKYGEESNGDT